MNALIEQVAADVVAMYTRVLPKVQTLDRHALDNLQHECQDLRHHDEYTIRTGAHVVEAAIAAVVEERRTKS